jgi:hypothetical protein
MDIRQHIDPRRSRASSGPEKCRRKFLKAFPRAFADETYLDWERNYKWSAHRRWLAVLDKRLFTELIAEGSYTEIAQRAVAVEGPTNLIFSYEKMALRDAVRSAHGAEQFAKGLYAFLHGNGPARARFDAWRDVVSALPRKQSRVLTWPILTVFGFIAQPRRHIYLKPTVMRRAAEAYGFPFKYHSKPNWATYESVLAFASRVSEDLVDWSPRDMIDIQSFLWVQGSEEY